MFIEKIRRNEHFTSGEKIMANYSRKRYRQLKEEYGFDYILLQDGSALLWTFDNDACELASWLDTPVKFNAKGEAFLKVSEEELKDYILDEIEDEDGAFFLWTTTFPGMGLPSSALMKVELLSNEEERTIIIVADDKEQDSKNGIYWVNRALSQSILHALDEKREEFEFDKVDYLIISTRSTAAYDEFCSRRYHFLNAEEKPQVIYVYKQKSYTNDLDLEPVTALFYYPGSAGPAEMTVFYSTSTDEYFVNQEVYNLFRKKHGLPFVALKMAKGEKFPTNPDMAEESILHMYGYNVSSSEGMTESERQNILARLVDYGIASKGKIENHLEIMIFLGEQNPKMANAVEKWRQDILFVNTYKIEDQRKIWISAVKTK